MIKLEYIYNTAISAIVGLAKDRKRLEQFLTVSKDRLDTSSFFVRNTLLSLPRLIAFMIMPRAQSCQSELETFFSGIGCPIPSKNAFSMKRRLISPDLFGYLNNMILEDFYRQPDLKMWKGRYVIAVDGTTMTMPVGARFEPLYGSARPPRNDGNRLPTARAVVLMDVLNDKILKIRLDKYDSHEPDLAIRAIMELPPYIRDNAIFIFDRLYLSYWLLTVLQNSNIQFVMRCRRNFSPALDAFFESDERYADLQLRPSKAVWGTKTSKRFEDMGIDPAQHRPIFIHATKSRLPGGEIEVICSCVAGIEISATQSYELYGRRWKVETGIGMEKNEWQIEIFSGYTKTAILQDVYCKIVSYNLCSMAITIANKKLQRQYLRRRVKSANRRHLLYKVNVNMALFNFKYLVIQVVKGKKLHTLLLAYIAETCRYHEPYRPGYSYPRNFVKHKISGKYATYSNYARVL